MADTLAGAWISVHPDLSGFGSELRTELDAAMAGTDKTVTVKANTTQAMAAVAKTLAATMVLTDKPHTATIDANATKANAVLADATAKFATFAAKSYTTSIGADDSSALGTLALLETAINRVVHNYTLDIDADTSAAMSKMAGLYSMASTTSGKNWNFGVPIARDASGNQLALGPTGSTGAGSNNWTAAELQAAFGGGGSSGGSGGGAGLGALLAGAAAGKGGAASGGLLKSLGWGGGLLGMAGFGSALDFAGLGASHLAVTGAGLAGFAGAGIAGGGLLGLGALGTAGVGMGTDMAGIGQAAGDIKNTYSAMMNLQTAVQTYGSGSQQAAQAQAQLNTQLLSFSQVARGAVTAAAQTAMGFHQMFNNLTGEAEKVGAEIINQAMQVGEKFLPTIGKYATQNMGIIQRDIQPLFAWMSSMGSTKMPIAGLGKNTSVATGGLGIFASLEKTFQGQLPTGLNALTKGIEIFANTVEVASKFTGPFLTAISNFLTKMATPKGLASWDNEIGKLIGDFRDWEQLIIAVVKDIAALFHNDAGTASSIVTTITQMLDKLHTWETSVSGKSSLHNIFEVSKNEILAIINLVPPLVGAFGQIFLKLGPPLHDIVTALATAAKAVVGFLSALGPSAGVLAWGASIAFLVVKLKDLYTAVAGTKLVTAIFGVGAASKTAAADVVEADATMGAANVAAGASFWTMEATGSRALGALVGSAAGAVGKIKLAFAGLGFGGLVLGVAGGLAAVGTANWLYNQTVPKTTAANSTNAAIMSQPGYVNNDPAIKAAWSKLVNQQSYSTVLKNNELSGYGNVLPKGVSTNAQILAWLDSQMRAAGINAQGGTATKAHPEGPGAPKHPPAVGSTAWWNALIKSLTTLGSTTAAVPGGNITPAGTAPGGGASALQNQVASVLSTMTGLTGTSTNAVTAQRTAIAAAMPAFNSAMVAAQQAGMTSLVNQLVAVHKAAMAQLVQLERTQRLQVKTSAVTDAATAAATKFTQTAAITADNLSVPGSGTAQAAQLALDTLTKQLQPAINAAQAKSDRLAITAPGTPQAQAALLALAQVQASTAKKLTPDQTKLAAAQAKDAATAAAAAQKVSMTTDQASGAAQQIADSTAIALQKAVIAQGGSTPVTSAQLNVDQVQKATDAQITAAQDQVDAAATGTALQQQTAAQQLADAQANQTKQLAAANAQLAAAQAQQAAAHTLATNAMTMASDVGNAVSTMVGDLSKVATDAMTANTDQVTAATQLSADISAAAVQAITDQSTIATDTLAERGLSGYALMAAQAKVALDKMTASYDAQIGATKVATDQATAQQTALVDAANTKLDQVTASTQAAVNAAQLAYDATLNSNDQAAQDAAAANLNNAKVAQQEQVAQAQADAASAQATASAIQAQGASALQGVQDQAAQSEAVQQATIDKLNAMANGAQGMVVNVEINGVPNALSAVDQTIFELKAAGAI